MSRTRTRTGVCTIHGNFYARASHYPSWLLFYVLLYYPPSRFARINQTAATTTNVRYVFFNVARGCPRTRGSITYLIYCHESNYNNDPVLTPDNENDYRFFFFLTNRNSNSRLLRSVVWINFFRIELTFANTPFFWSIANCVDRFKR